MFDGLDHSILPHYVPPREYARWATRLAPAMAMMAAGSGGRYAQEDIVAALCHGQMQLWLALDGVEIACVLVTELRHYPRCRAMRCIGVVGHRPRRWLHLLAQVELAAYEHFGCRMMEAMVQPGHERLLRTGGWKMFHSLWQKALG